MSYLKHKPGSIEEMMANQAKKLNDNAYQDMFKKELEKAGRGIGAMSPKEKKDFFNKIDDKYKAKNEEEVSKKDVDKFHTSLDKLVHKSFGHSSDEKKKEVKEEDAYDKDDEKPKSKPKKEAVDNPYAVGMAAAMKAKDDKPPLKKSTITKAHDIAKSIEKDQKEEVSQKEIDKFHTSLDKLVHKSFGHSSDEKKKEMKEARWEIEGRVSYKGISSEDSFHMVIDAPSKDAAERKAYNELDKARERRKIGPGGGGSIDDADIESIEKTTDRLSSPESGPMMNSYDPKLKEDFFVNDKKDTLKKFSGRVGYNKSTLTDYLAKKTGKNKNDVYFDDTELVYKDKNVLRNAETKTVDQMLKALQKEEVHPHVKKMVKDGESNAKIKKMHPELKDDELEKLKETHMSTAKSQNQRQREVGGEKETIKTPKNEWKTFAMMAAELRENNKADKGKKEQEAGEDTRDSKQKTMTGQTATSPEMNPRVDYKY